MLEPLDLESAIERGLVFLAKTQEADGSFVSFSSATIRPFRRLRSWRTVFVPALMLASLAGIDEPKAITIRRKLSDFLLNQKNDDWSFNYWAKNAAEYSSQPYPNDLDDTFCALAALYKHNSELVDAAALAKIVKLLLATEMSVGGPYRTWLVPADSESIWLDVDVAVNSNIAYFLSLTGSRLPRLDDLMADTISKGSFSSPYYPSKYAFIYYFSRSYRGKEQYQLLKKTRRFHKIAQTDLDRSLCLSARLQLDDTQDLDIAARDLLKGQRRDGSWSAAVFYADPVKNGKLYYNGSPALTTAFALEALYHYKQKTITAKRSAKTDLEQASSQGKAVAESAKDGCRDLDKDLLAMTFQALEETANSNNGPEISSLAERFNESLLKPSKLRENFLQTLAVANLYGWTAYTIYDDFLDEEGKPELIPVANALLRRSIDYFSRISSDNKSYQALVKQTFDTMDSANAWELSHCRFKVHSNKISVERLPSISKLDKLAERSIGHALPPLAILSIAGFKPSDKESQQTLKAFKHYLIARQLNDDAHDWPEDLQKGHITPVVAMLLSDLKTKPSEYELEKLVPKARKHFWHVTLLKVCHLVERHVRLSRQALADSGIFKSENFLNVMLDGIDESVKNTLSQQRQAADFFNHYKYKTKEVE